MKQATLVNGPRSPIRKCIQVTTVSTKRDLVFHIHQCVAVFLSSHPSEFAGLLYVIMLCGPSFCSNQFAAHLMNNEPHIVKERSRESAVTQLNCGGTRCKKAQTLVLGIASRSVTLYATKLKGSFGSDPSSAIPTLKARAYVRN